MSISLAKGITIISKRRSSVNEEMERLLLLSLKEMQLAGDTINKDLKKQEPGTSAYSLLFYHLYYLYYCAITFFILYGKNNFII